MIFPQGADGYDDKDVDDDYILTFELMLTLDGDYDDDEGDCDQDDELLLFCVGRGCLLC